MKDKLRRPGTLIIIGLLMVLFGAIAPFLVMLEIWPKNLIFLMFIIVVSSGGLMLGLIGSAMISAERKKREKYQRFY